MRQLPKRLLVLAAAVAALVAFTTLARPQESSSARLRIGESEGASPAAEPEEADEPASSGPFPRGFLRPLDPATLADVPSHLLEVDAVHLASEDGELIAVPDLYGSGGGLVGVLDARTLQPLRTVDLGDAGLVTSFVGFTAEADAVVVQLGGRSPAILSRHPLDPEQPTTRVELPEGTERAPLPHAQLPGGRVAMVVVERPRQGPTLARVVVADLLGERVLVDLALPDLQIDLFLSGEAGSSSQPGVAWDRTRERLYVAHADSSRVTVVDLTTGTVAAEAETGSPIPETGEAPVQRRRWAQVSPDGTRLYTAGSAFLPSSGSDEPFGLSVIDTATLAEVGRVERVSDWVQLSPDGRWLLWSPSSGSAGYAAIMATEQIGSVTLLGGREGASTPLGFSRDSSHVYLQGQAEGEETVLAYGLPSLQQTGERRLVGGSWFDPVGGLLRAPSG